MYLVIQRLDFKQDVLKGTVFVCELRKMRHSVGSKANVASANVSMTCAPSESKSARNDSSMFKTISFYGRKKNQCVKNVPDSELQSDETVCESAGLLNDSASTMEIDVPLDVSNISFGGSFNSTFVDQELAKDSDFDNSEFLDNTATVTSFIIDMENEKDSIDQGSEKELGKKSDLNLKKRKRNQMNYYEEKVDNDLSDCDDCDEFVPPKKHKQHLKNKAKGYKKTEKCASKNNGKRVTRTKTITFENDNTYRKPDKKIKKTPKKGKSENNIGKILVLDVDDKENLPIEGEKPVQNGTIRAESQANSPVKQGRKETKVRSSHPETWYDNSIRIARNAGEAYTYKVKGKTNEWKKRAERKVGNPCNCQSKCFEKIGMEKMKIMNDNFWKLKNYNLQNQHLEKLIVQTETKAQKILGDSNSARNKYKCSFFVCWENEKYLYAKMHF